MPLLNFYYHRWADGQPANIPQSADQPTTTPTGQTTQPTILPPLSGTSGLLDNFEAGPPAGTAGWEGYFQDNTDTRLTCAPASGNAHGGAASLKFEFDMAVNSWATCGFYFDSNQNWTRGQGISFYLRADQSGLPFTVDLYGGSPGGRTTYQFQTQTPPESVDNWTLVEVRWNQILRAEWEENPGTPFNPAEVTGFSFGLAAPENSRLKGTLWVDDLSLLGTAAPVTASAPADISTAQPPTQVSAPTARNPLCCGSLLLPLFLSLLFFFAAKMKC